MLILFGFLLLILAVAVGVLFAMCAELSKRLSSSAGSQSANTVAYARPVERPGVFLRPDVVWPREFRDIASRDAFLLIVISTSCMTCNSVASELGEGWAKRGSGRMGVVISTPDEARAKAYVAEHHLGGIPHIIDVDGTWTTESLGLSLSPVGAVFLGGSLHETYIFNQVEPLWHSFTEEILCAQESQQTEHHASLDEGSSRPSAPVA